MALSKDERPVCGTCRFFVQHPGEIIEGAHAPGYCKFKPPVHSPIGASTWPEVMDNTSGCGKHPDILMEHIGEIVSRSAPLVLEMYESITPGLMAMAERMVETPTGGPDDDHLEPRSGGQPS